MTNEKIKVIIGGLLHDIGKPIQREIHSINHSDAGYAFLKNELKLNDKDILSQVKYHHKSALKSADLPEDSYAYITYIADNIASGADRRKNDDTGDSGFQIDTPMHSVYNILNGNKECFYYRPVTMDEKDGINYPTPGKVSFSEELYRKIKADLSDCIKGIDIHNNGYVNSLLELLEADCSYIPSSTKKEELPDISLYDHLKTTAAIGSCIYDFLSSKNETDYRKYLFEKENDFYNENAFLMYSFDVSGIQSFIYTIKSKGALKMLRSRSFYVEILCEHYIDTLLNRLELSRANLIYSGGGHGYIILPNTAETKTILDRAHKEVNRWLIDKFGTALYIASAYTECPAKDLMSESGKTNEKYKMIFETLSELLSKEKSSKYSAKDIIYLNNRSQDGKRECSVCGKSGTDIKNDMCDLCGQLVGMSNDIADEEFFVVTSGEEGLKLPFGQCIKGVKRDELVELMNRPDYVRSYCKNKQFTGFNISTKLWIGDYCPREEGSGKIKEFTKLAKLSGEAGAVEKIGIIRADVDNLGKAFVSGFPPEYVSLSRTAAFSRSLSLFFKKHINTLLKDNDIKATIVYSGGDDVFMAAAWNDALKAVTVLRDALEKFSIGSLTISAGVGMYDAKYPVSNMALECGKLESRSKSRGRNRITLFTDDDIKNEEYTYTWEELREKVIGEKKQALEKFFDGNDEHGMNLMYNLLDYIRNIDDKINIARFAYTLSKIEINETDKEKLEEKKEKLKEFEKQMFEKQMYEWALNEADRKQLITAMYLYVYENRNKKNKKEEE